jgi:hypothetical protein
MKPEPTKPEPEWKAWLAKLPGGHANRRLIEQLVAVDPAHAQQYWDRWNSEEGFAVDHVKALIARGLVHRR